jgi:hypothetical protein
VLLPRQHQKLARGANDKEHAMSQNLNTPHGSSLLIPAQAAHHNEMMSPAVTE